MEVVMAFTGDEDEAIIFTNVACVNRVIYDGGGGRHVVKSTDVRVEMCWLSQQGASCLIG